MIINFKNFLFAFPWRPHGPGHKLITKVWKSIFPLFCWWVLSKMRLWIKLTIVSITQWQSLYIIESNWGLLTSLCWQSIGRNLWPQFVYMSVLLNWKKKKKPKTKHRSAGGHKQHTSPAPVSAHCWYYSLRFTVSVWILCKAKFITYLNAKRFFIALSYAYNFHFWGYRTWHELASIR